MNSNFDNFKLVAKPRFGTVSGNAQQARVAVRNKTAFKQVAALAEQHGGTVQPATASYPQLVLVTFADAVDTHPLDAVTRSLSAFGSFAELLDAKGGYRPTIHLDRDGALALADAYDAAQAARGDERRAYRRPAVDTGDDATYELRNIVLDWDDNSPVLIVGRARAEQALRTFADEFDYDVHIHPTVYTDGSRSTAYTRGGDSLLNAVASLRRLF